MSHLVIQWCTIFLFSVLYKIPVFSVVQNSCFQWCTIFLYEMLYLSLFCLNLSYKSLDVYNSGGGVVPNSDVYKYSDPISAHHRAALDLRRARLSGRRRRRPGERHFGQKDPFQEEEGESSSARCSSNGDGTGMNGREYCNSLSFENSIRRTTVRSRTYLECNVSQG